MSNTFRLVLSLAIGLWGAALTAQTSRVLSVEQVGIANTKPAVQTYAITASLSEADGVYRIGDPIFLSLRLDRSAYVLVVNVDDAGQMAQLYPNEFNKDNFLEAGKELVLPGPGTRLVANGPPATELIKIIATEKPLTIKDVSVAAPAGPFLVSPPGSSRKLSRALGVKTMTPDSGEGAGSEPSGFGRWGELTLLLTTVDNKQSDASWGLGRPMVPLEIVGQAGNPT